LLWKSVGENFILHSGFLEIFMRLFCDKATILMYHRVPQKAFYENEFSCGLFEKQIEYLIKRHNLISLEELVKYLKAGNTPPKNSVVITFDDGYIDNYLHAYPILKKYNVPATIFLSTDFIETKRLFPMDKIEYIISKSKKEYLQIDLSSYNSCSNNGFWEVKLEGCRSPARSAVWEIAKSLSPIDTEKLIEELALQQEVKIPDSVGEERYTPLLWNQVREMAKNGITFGCHTCNHSMLTKLEHSEAYSEILNSKKLIEERLGKKVSYFAYPYGDFNKDIKGILKELGFRTAVSTINGLNSLNTDLFELKRYSGTYQIPRLARIVSGFSYFKNKWL